MIYSYFNLQNWQSPAASRKRFQLLQTGLFLIYFDIDALRIISTFVIFSDINVK